MLAGIILFLDFFIRRPTIWAKLSTSFICLRSPWPYLVLRCHRRIQSQRLYYLHWLAPMGNHEIRFGESNPLHCWTVLVITDCACTKGSQLDAWLLCLCELKGMAFRLVLKASVGCCLLPSVSSIAIHDARTWLWSRRSIAMSTAADSVIIVPKCDEGCEF